MISLEDKHLSSEVKEDESVKYDGTELPSKEVIFSKYRASSTLEMIRSFEALQEDGNLRTALPASFSQFVKHETDTAIPKKKPTVMPADNPATPHAVNLLSKSSQSVGPSCSQRKVICQW